MTWARWFHDSSGAGIKIGKKTKVKLSKLSQSAAFFPDNNNNETLRRNYAENGNYLQ